MKANKKVRKAIIPVAGMGTRFLPATKAQPKSMLPIIDKPVIQYLVEEAVDAGIEEVIFITGRGKQSLENHFDYAPELDRALIEKGKDELAKSMRAIAEMVRVSYTRQRIPKGDGDAIAAAEHLIGEDEPVATFFEDDLIDNNPSCLKQLLTVYEEYEAPVFALMELPEEDDISKYGVIKGEKVKDRLYKIDSMIEKPPADKAPSRLIHIGRSIITPAVFAEIHKQDNSDEIRLARAYDSLARSGAPVYGYQFTGKRYDCGNKASFVEAIIDYALKHPETRESTRAYLTRVK